MSTKKLLSFFMIIIMIFAFAACGKGGQGEKGSTTEPTLAPPVKQWGGLSNGEENTKKGKNKEETTVPAVLTNEMMRKTVESVMGSDYNWNGKLSSLSAENQRKVESALREQGFDVTIKDGKLIYNETTESAETEVVTVPADKVNEAAQKAVGDDWNGNVSDLNEKQKEKLQEELNKDSDTEITILDNNNIVYVKPVTTKSSETTEAGKNNTTTVKDSGSNTTETTKKDQTTTKEQTTKKPAADETSTKKPLSTTAPEGTTIDVVVPTVNETTTEQQPGSPKLTGLKRTLADTYGGSSNDRFISVTATKDGGYAVIAEVSSSDGDYSKITGSSGGKKGVVIKFDKDGKELWKQAYLGQKHGIKFYDIAELTDGSLVVVGDSSDTVVDGKPLEGSGDSLNGIIAKLSASGEKLWIKSVGGSDGEYFSSVAATPDGAFVVGGKVTSSDGPFEGLPYGLIHAVLIRFDADGELYWPWALSGKMHSIITDVAVNENGQIFAACNTKSKDLIDAAGNKVAGIGNGSMDAVVVKLDKNRKFIWSQVYAGNGEDSIGGIVCTEDGGCVVAGNFAARSFTPSGTFAGCRYYGSTEGAVAKYSSDGKLVAPVTILSGSGAETVTGITAVKGGYIVSGYTSSTDVNLVSDCKLGENKGRTDAIIWLLDANREDIRLASVGGSERDEAYAIASNGTSVMVVGATMSSDGDFEGQKPVGANGKFTSFMAAYNILSSNVS